MLLVMANKHSESLDCSAIMYKTKLNWFERACIKICPCFGRKRDKNYLTDSSKLRMNVSMTEACELPQMPKITADEPTVKRPSKVLHKSVLHTAPSKDDVKEYLKGRRTIPPSLEACPILNCREKEVLLLGEHHSFKMLAMVTHVRLAPNRQVLKKLKESIQESRGAFSNPKREAFWAKRYLLFEKFDQGVRLDQDSWTEVIPEAIAEHIAIRAQANSLLDAYCGVGSASIKFAATCKTVFATDDNKLRLECLVENARVYSADNIMKLSEDFLQLSSTKADTVFLCPPVRADFSQSSEVDPGTYFRPQLGLLIKKSLQIAPNLIMLLRPNFSIQKLCQLFHRILSDSKSSLCSLDFEKIYFMGELKYVAVYYGPAVNRQLKLKDELEHLYRMVNGTSEVFRHVRVFKEVRERIGMVGLLSLISEARGMFNYEVIEAFYDLVRRKRLVPPGKLALLIAQQNQEAGLALHMARPSLVEFPSEQTKSFTSTNSLAEHEFGFGEHLRQTRVTDGIYRFDD